MSSISPIETKVFAKQINALPCEYADAPVSGGDVGAREASLAIMVGGNGDGQTTKVANQIIVAVTIAAVGEALLFAARAGADPARVRQALMGGFASSRILERHGERTLKRNFTDRAAPEGSEPGAAGCAR